MGVGSERTHAKKRMETSSSSEKASAAPRGPNGPTPRSEWKQYSYQQDFNRERTWSNGPHAKKRMEAAPHMFDAWVLRSVRV